MESKNNKQNKKNSLNTIKTYLCNQNLKSRSSGALKEKQRQLCSTPMPLSPSLYIRQKELLLLLLADADVSARGVPAILEWLQFSFRAHLIQPLGSVLVQRHLDFLPVLAKVIILDHVHSTFRVVGCDLPLVILVYL